MKKLATTLIFTGLTATTAMAGDTTFLGLDVPPPELEFKTFSVTGHHNLLNVSDNWLIIGFVLFSLLLIFLDISTKNSFTEIIRLNFSRVRLKNFFEETQKLVNRALNALTVLSLLINPFFITLSLKVLFGFTFAKGFIIGFALSFLLLFTYRLSQLILGYIFKIKDLITKQIAILKIFYATNAIILFILSFFTVFAVEKLRIIITSAGILFFIVTYILKTYRELQTFNESNVSVLYFILYFCSVEILPVLITLTLIKH